MRPPLAALALLALACAPAVDPEKLGPQRPFATVTLTTAPQAGETTALPEATRTFALSSTYAFDHACRFDGGFAFTVRADAAPALELEAGPWAPKGPNRFTLDCTVDEACERTRAMVRWDGDDGRYDASPANPEAGLATPTKCVASFAADALDSTQVVLEGSCDPLLGTFTRPGEQPRFGPVRLSFRALCPRPE